MNLNVNLSIFAKYLGTGPLTIKDGFESMFFCQNIIPSIDFNDQLFQMN